MVNPSKSGKLYKKAASISLLTLVSRILGVVRDALIAFVFGASAATDVFFVVFRPFDLLRKMMSEGILSISFVPEFSRLLADKNNNERTGMEKAGGMALSALFWVSVVSVVFVCLGLWLAPAIIPVLAPGYANDPYAGVLAATLLKLMLPYGGVIFMVALSMGLLNALGNFAAPAATPVLLNLTIIGATLLLKDLFDPGVMVLAFGVTLGGVVQLLFQLPWLRGRGLFSFRYFSLRHSGVIRAGRTMLPSMIGAASFQINVLTAGLIATTLMPGSVSYLYYAERLVQFPLALFVTSVSTVFLPLLSEKAAVSDMEAVQPAFESSMRLVFFLTIPAMAGIMALDEHIVSFLFGRGAFDGGAVERTANCLFFLASGLWAVAGTRLFITYHYAVRNIRLPFYAGVLSVLANLGFGLLLVRPLGVTGLAISVSLAAVVGFIFLLYRSGTGINRAGLLVSACRALFLSGIMAVLVIWLGRVLISDTGPALGFGLFTVIVAGAGCFFTGALLIKSPELELIKKVVSKRK
ncbi:MAG: murein biosynthesis integral membrane protein MurJ [Desulfobacterales bacterium]|nr:murein biosynthesis integral membrane protein MurJ [Desulfobacterales bacterium]